MLYVGERGRGGGLAGVVGWEREKGKASGEGREAYTGGGEEEKYTRVQHMTATLPHIP